MQWSGSGLRSARVREIGSTLQARTGRTESEIIGEVVDPDRPIAATTRDVMWRKWLGWHARYQAAARKDQKITNVGQAVTEGVDDVEGSGPADRNPYQ